MSAILMTTTPNKKTIATRLIIVLLFCVFVGHSIVHNSSVDLSSDTVEFQHCKLCQQLVDPTEQKIKLAKITLGYFSIDNQKQENNLIALDKYIKASPRAPPHTT